MESDKDQVYSSSHNVVNFINFKVENIMKILENYGRKLDNDKCEKTSRSEDIAKMGELLSDPNVRKEFSKRRKEMHFRIGKVWRDNMDKLY